MSAAGLDLLAREGHVLRKLRFTHKTQKYHVDFHHFRFERSEHNFHRAHIAPTGSDGAIDDLCQLSFKKGSMIVPSDFNKCRVNGPKPEDLNKLAGIIYSIDSTELVVSFRRLRFDYQVLYDFIKSSSTRSMETMMDTMGDMMALLPGQYPHVIKLFFEQAHLPLPPLDKLSPYRLNSIEDEDDEDCVEEAVACPAPQSLTINQAASQTIRSLINIPDQVDQLEQSLRRLSLSSDVTSTDDSGVEEKDSSVCSSSSNAGSASPIGMQDLAPSGHYNLSIRSWNIYNDRQGLLSKGGRKKLRKNLR